MAVATTWETTGCFRTASLVSTVTLDTIASYFTACGSMSSSFISCNNTVPKSALPSCICDQTLFNEIYDCESEWRLCLDSYKADGFAQQYLSQWHGICGSVSMPTTPVLSTLTSTQAPLEVCKDFATACQYTVERRQRCSESYNPVMSSALSSCECEAPILSAASVCEYDGNKTCLGTPAALSNIGLWESCSAQASAYLSTRSNEATSTRIAGSLPVSTSSAAPSQSMSHSVPSSTTPPSTTPPSTSTKTSTPSPAASTTATGGSNAARLQLMGKSRPTLSLLGTVVLLACLQQIVLG